VNANRLACKLCAGARTEIREASPAERRIWDDLVRRFANYRIAHTRGWVRSLEESTGGRALYLLFEKDGEVVGCLPGLVIRWGLLHLFGSPLPGWQTTSMGPAFDPQRLSTRELITSLIPYLQERHRIHHMELVGSDLDAGSMQELGFWDEPVPTYRAPLFPGNEDQALRALKDSARRNIRRAVRLGLRVRFEGGEEFVDEYYNQIKEVWAGHGKAVPFSKRRVLEFFRHMKAAGNLRAVSVYLPDGRRNIATSTFTIEGRELLLWQWAHRRQYRWYRPTELMTWTVMQQAMAAGCDTFDLMGLGEFKTKFGAKLDSSKHRWVRSRYRWLTPARSLAKACHEWQQSIRGRLARLHRWAALKLFG
jgi:hypothetical protein